MPRRKSNSYPKDQRSSSSAGTPALCLFLIRDKSLADDRFRRECWHTTTPSRTIFCFWTGDAQSRAILGFLNGDFERVPCGIAGMILLKSSQFIAPARASQICELFLSHDPSYGSPSLEENYAPTTGAGKNRAEGIRLFTLAGRPSKEDFVKVYGPAGPKMTWEQRAEAGVPAEKFQAALASAMRQAK